MAASLQLNPAYGLETVPCVALQKKKKTEIPSNNKNAGHGINLWSLAPPSGNM